MRNHYFFTTFETIIFLGLLKRIQAEKSEASRTFQGGTDLDNLTKTDKSLDIKVNFKTKMSLDHRGNRVVNGKL